MNTSQWKPPVSVAERMARGAAVRKTTPRSALAELPTWTRDPLGIIASQNVGRVRELVPIRMERMSQSPFTFYRGTAAIMAADLANAPHSGILVGSSGDAHVSNFGYYASPERRLMFDLNDFDESAWAPWEWDVKRLTTSVVIGGRASGRDESVIERAVHSCLGAYSRGIRKVVQLSPTVRYFTRFDVASTTKLLDKASRRAIRSSTKDAIRHTGSRAVKKLTQVDETGRRRFLLDEPTTTAVSARGNALVHRVTNEYLRTTHPDVALLFEHFTVSDIARRAVGVGSVGTRCYLVLFQDGEGNTILMQPKEASQSVLAEYGKITQPPLVQRLIDSQGEGARVVGMQRILQALSDPFLGHLRSKDGDYYVRQFHDMKGGIEVETLEDDTFVTYAVACAAALARAHGQSLTSPSVAGYLGKGSGVKKALASWAFAYADRSLADYHAFVASK